MYGCKIRFTEFTSMYYITLASLFMHSYVIAMGIPIGFITFESTSFKSLLQFCSHTAHKHHIKHSHRQKVQKMQKTKQQRLIHVLCIQFDGIGDENVYVFFFFSFLCHFDYCDCNYNLSAAQTHFITIYYWR